MNDVAFSPSGAYSFIIGHDSSLFILDNKTLKTTEVFMNNNACSSVIPISDSKIILLSYDREIFQYENTSGTWTRTKVISDVKATEQPKASSNASAGQSTGSASVFDKLKQFDVSHQMKKSVLNTTGNDNTDLSNVKPAHSVTISSAIVSGNELITTDISGFIKIWKL